jgi:predicted hydrocarbon binding protein
MIIFRRRQKGGGLLMRADTKVNMCQAIREMREEERMKGEEYGRKIGEERGRKVGEEQQNELMRRLLQDDRLEDLRRAVNDRDYREQLFIEYKIKDR